MILVTGGTGLLGSHLLYDLLTQGQQVKVLIRPSSNKQSVLSIFNYYTRTPQELFNKIIWEEGDITDLVSLKRAFKNVEKVYHTAACVSFHPTDKRKIYTTNVVGTSNIVNLCLEYRIKKLCFVSSIAAVGSAEDGTPAPENLFWKPQKDLSDYSISKYKAEMEVWRGIAEGLNAVIVNPSVILGPGNWHTGSNLFFDLIAKGQKYYTSGTNGYVDVRDVVRVMIKLMESDICSERFILSSENISYRSFFSAIASKLNLPGPQKYASPRLTSLAYRLERARSLVCMTNPRITKNTAGASHKKLAYSNLKVQKTLGITFHPISDTIQFTAQFYTEEVLKK